MYSENKVRGQRWLPHTILLAWLAFLGLSIAGYARRTDLPPTYDAGTYFLKGYNFWNSLHQHKFVNPLNLEPESRGPGTILMSFPFGFSSDFRTFYFRSVFLPILFIVSALYLACFDVAMPCASQWNLAIFAIFLSSLPIFYHFELSDSLPSPVYWGLVDNFLAGIMALAAGASVRSLRNRSLHWWLVAVLLAAFSLFVKPAGGVLILALDLAWFCALMIEYLRIDRSKRKPIIVLLALGTLAAAVIEGGVIALCVRSRYLSSENIAAGARSLQSFQANFRATVTLKLLHGIILNSFGYVLPATAIFLLLLGIHHRKDVLLGAHASGLMNLLNLTAGWGIILLIGLWFWVIATDISQDRYFYPFGTAALIYAGPAVLAALARANPFPRRIVRSLWVASCLNLAFLLAQGNASASWQRWSGVSLISGGKRAEVAQATNLLDEVRNSGKDAVAYAMDTGASFATFSSVAAYRSVVEPKRPRLIIQFPVNWQTGTFYTLSDMVDADFLIFRAFRGEATPKSVLSASSVRDLTQESQLFQAWFSGLTDHDGVAEKSDGPVRVLRVVDRIKLRASLDKLVSEHSWPYNFLQSNPKEWWGADELQQAEATLHSRVSDTEFGDEVDLRVLTIARDSESTTLRLWWNWKRPPQYDWRFFCHVIDEQGSILDNYEVTLYKRPSPYQDRPIRLTSLSFQSTHGNGAYGLAVGVYAPGIRMIEANRGNRDWNNTRVIVPFEARK